MSVRQDLAYSGVKPPSLIHSRWLQAGLKSFAYRLAHLALGRTAMIAIAATMFYLA